MSDSVPPASSDQEKSNAGEQEKAREAFLRWQEVRRVQLGHTVNLVLTLTTASLGFGLHLLISGEVTSVHILGCALAVKQVFFIALFVLLMAVAFGLGVNYSRLLDFRYTARAARARERNETAKHKEYRQEAKRFENCTWKLLKFQLITFFLGTVLLAWGIWVGLVK